MNATFILKCAKYRYILHRILLRFKMGKKARDEYMRKTKLTYLDFLPEILYAGKLCEKNGIKGIPRARTDDFLVLFVEREVELKPHLAMYAGETFVDVGANVGFYPIRLAKDYEDKKLKIIAIEPHSGNYEALCTNIACNDLKNIKTINKAVSDHAGIIQMYEHPGSDRHVYTGQFSLDARSDSDEASESEVECDTLDNILSEHRCDVIKIDIEGEEVKALKGAEKTMKKARKVIVEIHGQNGPEVKKILEKHGFEIEISGKGIMNYVIGSRRQLDKS
jgi:FkbM family methyltransferase